MNELDQKINTHFPGLVVRKDLVKTVRGNAIVPSYVLEYLLGQYCATCDEPTIQTGIEIELGPKGTGKSHIYSEFSPHGILISGGEVTVPKLFVNNSTGKIGLVGYWDCVGFDEFAGKQKRVDKALVDIMKNYMANKSFSRGVETLGAEASVVFVGNTQHTLPYMLKHSDLFSELPDKFYDSAFLDRIHFYIPGWEVDIIRGEMFSSGYGEEYPNYYHKTISEGKDGKSGSPVVPSEALKDSGPSLKEKHLTFQENQKGISFDTLFGPYLKGATQITVTDPYIRLFYQMRNFMEFLETVVKHKALDEEVSVNLVTTEDEFKGEQQEENLEKMKESASSLGVNLTWKFDGTGTIHARHILTDHGWKISLDRGLDIFLHYEMNDTFIFTNRLQQFRPCKAFEMTFIKADEN